MAPTPDRSLVTAHLVNSDGIDGLRSRLDRAEAGDIAALGTLFEEFGDLAYRAALRLTGNRADAEDVTQEVFVRLPGALRGFVGGAPAFAVWLRKVVVRQALVQMRGHRRRREVAVDGVAALFAPSDGVIERMTIDRALERVPTEHRAVFLLKEVEGYSHAEIAELLGITVANSEVRLHRARRQLRDLLRGSR